MPRGDFWPHWTVRLKAASQPDGSGEQNIRRSVPNYGIGGSQRVV